MLYTSSVTQKGQITLPKKLRDSLNIKAYGKVRIKAEDGYIKVIPTKDILDIAGIFEKEVKGKGVLKARDQFEKTYERK